MAKNSITANSISSYRVSSNGVVIPCTGATKQIANKRAKIIIKKETNRILDIIGVQ